MGASASWYNFRQAHGVHEQLPQYWSDGAPEKVAVLFMLLIATVFVNSESWHSSLEEPMPCGVFTCTHELNSCVRIDLRAS